MLARSGAEAEDGSPSREILAEQVRLLYAGTFVIPANFLNAAIVGAALWRSYPRDLLLAWLAASGIVVALRLFLRRRYRLAAAGTHEPLLWARRYAAGAVASGVLWGALCGALPFFGRPLDFLFVTLVAAAMSAAAMTSLAAYYPAFLGYLLPFILPAGFAFLLTPGPD